MQRFRLYLINFFYFLEGEHDDFRSALARAISTGFEVAIYRGDQMVASWGPIRGLVMYTDSGTVNVPLRPADLEDEIEAARRMR
jgi:hypothetical protein